MSLKTAFAVYVKGDRYARYGKNLVESIEKYVPGVPVVEIDDGQICDALPEAKDSGLSVFPRLAIPLMDAFSGYDRVIWIDADSDIVSERFADILSVGTGKDGLSAVQDEDAGRQAALLNARRPGRTGRAYFDLAVLVFDIVKMDRSNWRSAVLDLLKEHAVNPFENGEDDIINILFEICPMNRRFNWVWTHGVDPNRSAYLVHYGSDRGKAMLDEILDIRNGPGNAKSWKDRCVVVSPRHAFIRPWIRSYFANGNTAPLVIVPGPPGDWSDEDMEYCAAAAKFSGGCILDCSREWSDSRRLARRAVRQNVGWYTKKSILHAVATRLDPKEWAWIDDDAEVTGNLDECFDVAGKAPGFIFSQFYYPSTIDNRHPERMYRSNIDTGDKICWNSLVFFHGDANRHLSEQLGKDFPVEDDEIVFGYLYQNNPEWRDGFCDFSIRGWQKNCKLLNQIPENWNGKLLHYTSQRNGGEVKKMWERKAFIIRPAPFEKRSYSPCTINAEDDGPVDAVFVIGTGSVGGNEELRYALRNLDRNCPFVRDVYICGFCPSWVDRTVVRHLNWPDRFSHAKDANIIDKLRHACEQPGIAKRILFCSDDQFQTRVCTWDDFTPRYLRRYASNDGWYEGRRRVWHSRLRKTLEREVMRRKKIGLDASDVFYYQPHIWMPVDRDMFIEYARWCGYERRDDTIIASGYYNFANVNGRPDFDHVFIGNNVTSVPNATHVAYHDGSYGAAMKILKEMFPSACRFEIQNTTSPAGTTDTRQGVSCQKKSHSVTASHSAAEGDPSPASPLETAEIHALSASVRDNPTWSNLLGEISRAEELRLFGVTGWRTVWNDIKTRWSRATCNGTDNVPVTDPRSEAAAAIVNAYCQNPDAMRTVRFGPQNQIEPKPIWRNGMRSSEQANSEVRESLHARVRCTLR